MSNPALLSQADTAFDAGRSADGLALLRQYNQDNRNDAASWHRQAIVEEQIGLASEAGRAHHRCLEIAPNNALGFLYAGSFLNQQKQSNAAAALFSIAQDLDSSILNLSSHSNISPQTRQRSQQANHLLRQVLSRHHRDTCRDLPNATRISNAQWVPTHDQEVAYSPNNFAPELFYIPDLPAKPVYPPSDAQWCAHFTANASAIKQELEQVLGQQTAKANLRPYLGQQFSNHSSLGQLANSTSWQAMDLYRNGELNEALASAFPATLNAIKGAPCYALDSSPFEVFFSFLKPQQQIAPHFGESNHALTAHLALDIPADCHLRVDHQDYAWRESELLIFDDSFLHSAHNNSAHTRVVLIFSVWHPDLSHDERRAIQISFQARQKWLSERHSHLIQLLEIN